MEKRCFRISVFFVCVFVLLQMASSATDTSLNIDNAPPVLLSPIPNQSWDGGNLLDAFDLDDYFFSTLNLTLSYSSTDVDNITVFISPSNVVSFYPDASFSGEREVIFNASDGIANTSSNVVKLFVGLDDEPPKWSLMEKDKSVIYQSSYVTFSTTWTDNYGLANFVLYINELESYLGYPGNFTGLTNISSKQVQISAPAGQTVYWFFCANDTSMNQNCSDVTSFLVSTKPTPPGGGSSSDEDEGSSSTSKKVAEILKKDVNDFILSSYSFLVPLKQGSFQTKILEITNIGNTKLNFTLSVSGINEFVTLGEDYFEILPGESKKVALDFFSKKDTIPGQYFGQIAVDSFKTVIIPVAINVNPLESDASVSVSVPDEYKFVKPGNEVAANIVLKSLKDPIEGDVLLHISVQDFYGNVYNFSEENVTLGSSTLSFQRNLTTFEDMPLGEYIFHARVSKGDELFSVDSDIFEIGIRFRFLAFLKSSFVFLLLLFLSFLSVFLVWKYRDIEKRKQALNLYIDSLELKKLMALDKFDEAVELFIRMKSVYGEPVTRSMLENKEALKAQMKNLVEKFDLKNDPSIKADLKEKSKKEVKDKEKAALPSEKVENKNVIKDKTSQKKVEVKEQDKVKPAKTKKDKKEVPSSKKVKARSLSKEVKK